MSSLKRSRTFATDAQSVRFLYLILKQLDLKSVNWQAVADGLGIKNGHAARMRWSRFKQHVEDDTIERKEKPQSKKGDCEKTSGKRMREENLNEFKMEDEYMDNKRVKLEYAYGRQPNYLPPSYGYPGNLPNPMPLLPPQPQYVKTESNFQPNMGMLGYGPQSLAPTSQMWQPTSSNMISPAVSLRNPSMIPGFDPVWEDPDDKPLKDYHSSVPTTVSPPQVHLKTEPSFQSPQLSKLTNSGPSGLTPTISQPPSTGNGTISQAQELSSSKLSQSQCKSEPSQNSSATNIKTAAKVSSVSVTADSSKPACTTVEAQKSGFVKVKPEPEIIELTSPLVKAEADIARSSERDISPIQEYRKMVQPACFGPESASNNMSQLMEGSGDKSNDIVDATPSAELGQFVTIANKNLPIKTTHQAPNQTTLFDFFTKKTGQNRNVSTPPAEATVQATIIDNPATQAQDVAFNTESIQSEERQPVQSVQSGFAFHNLFPTSFDPLFSPTDEMEYEFDLEDMIKDLPYGKEEGDADDSPDKSHAASENKSIEVADDMK